MSLNTGSGPESVSLRRPPRVRAGHSPGGLQRLTDIRPHTRAAARAAEARGAGEAAGKASSSYPSCRPKVRPRLRGGARWGPWRPRAAPADENGREKSLAGATESGGCAERSARSNVVPSRLRFQSGALSAESRHQPPRCDAPTGELEVLCKFSTIAPQKTIEESAGCALGGGATSPWTEPARLAVGVVALVRARHGAGPYRSGTWERQRALSQIVRTFCERGASTPS